ncbi:MAG: hypothetical protein AAF335_03410 [Bacteroidota bacterium]
MKPEFITDTQGRKKSCFKLKRIYRSYGGGTLEDLEDTIVGLKARLVKNPKCKVPKINSVSLLQPLTLQVSLVDKLVWQVFEFQQKCFNKIKFTNPKNEAIKKE